MNPKRHLSPYLAAIAVLASLIPVSSFAQSRPMWRTAADVTDGDRGAIVGTVNDLNSARNQLSIVADGDRTTNVAVETDSVSTQYAGFGDSSDGTGDLFSGSVGFSKLELGDRVEVRGIGRGFGSISADQIVLLDRSAPARNTTGGNSAGSPNNASTRITTTASGTMAAYGTRIEGIVRQVNPAEGRVMVETDRREIITIRGNASTPVGYQGQTFQLSNLQAGDRISVDSATGYTPGSEVAARAIEVISSVQGGDDGSAGGGGNAAANSRRFASISGRVTRIDRRSDTFRIDAGLGTEVTVNSTQANDDGGRPVRAADVAVGDGVELSGNYDASNIFRAATIRFIDAPAAATAGGTAAGGATAGNYAGGDDYVIATIYGTVTATLQSSPQLTVRDDQGRAVRVLATDDFAVRKVNGTYTTAESLKANDRVVMKVYRAPDGTSIAQSIRLR
jgi:hypothetical protein